MYPVLKSGEHITKIKGLTARYVHYSEKYGSYFSNKKQQKRNDICLCGSNLKYKKCCLNKNK